MQHKLKSARSLSSHSNNICTFAKSNRAKTNNSYIHKPNNKFEAELRDIDVTFVKPLSIKEKRRVINVFMEILSRYGTSDPNDKVTKIVSDLLFYYEIIE